MIQFLLAGCIIRLLLSSFSLIVIVLRIMTLYARLRAL